jgi:pyruvate formate lyase activating enzyme
MENVLVTNGTAEPEILEEIIDFIDAMNIDLKAFSKDFYHDLIDGDLEMTKVFIEKSVGKCHVELTTLVIPGENDSEEEMRALSSWVADLETRYNKKIPLHITRFFPRFHMTDKEPTPVRKILELVNVAKEKLEYVFPGNIPGT